MVTRRNRSGFQPERNDKYPTFVVSDILMSRVQYVHQRIYWEGGVELEGWGGVCVCVPLIELVFQKKFIQIRQIFLLVMLGGLQYLGFSICLCLHLKHNHKAVNVVTFLLNEGLVRIIFAEGTHLHGVGVSNRSLPEVHC